MTKEDVIMLIEANDADGVYSMLLDMGEDELAEWVEETYFQ